jgi:pimeloyl-ACP methyl ester carboxylesterase
MPPVPVVMLPGLDGTGRLFEPFVAQLPNGFTPIVVRYPTACPLGYADLRLLVEAELPTHGQFVLLGESFSSPLAARIATDQHPHLAALILVGSFVRSPVPSWLMRLPRLVASWCFQVPPPAWAIRRFLAGHDAPAELVAAVRAALRTVSPAVLAHRVREVLALDVRDDLRRVRVPVLALAGAKDRLVSSRNVDDLRFLGDLLEVEFLDAPHLILQRQPAAAAAAIKRFLERHAVPCSLPDRRA